MAFVLIINNTIFPKEKVCVILVNVLVSVFVDILRRN